MRRSNQTTSGTSRRVRNTAREARARRSFDGVLASYVRELAAGADLTTRSALPRTPDR
jgi:hypothetical protein